MVKIQDKYEFLDYDKKSKDILMGDNVKTN